MPAKYRMLCSRRTVCLPNTNTECCVAGGQCVCKIQILLQADSVPAKYRILSRRWTVCLPNTEYCLAGGQCACLIPNSVLQADSVPEYNDATWFTMLFSCGVSTGLFFFGVAEPIQHYTGKNRYTVGRLRSTADLFAHF